MSPSFFSSSFHHCFPSKTGLLFDSDSHPCLFLPSPQVNQNIVLTFSNFPFSPLNSLSLSHAEIALPHFPSSSEKSLPKFIPS